MYTRVFSMGRPDTSVQLCGQSYHYMDRDMGHDFSYPRLLLVNGADEWFSILPDGVMEPTRADVGLSYASRA